MGQSLPQAFLHQIEEQLGKEAAEFLATYEQSRTHGLRLNELKLDMTSPLWQQFIQHYKLESIPWCSTGYYYEDQLRPGKHPYHTAGLYYIQEPSAMSAVELLAPQPGETILDLAAAPGGKTSHIASKLQGKGLLVSNEIHPERAKILAENVERMGIPNVVVTSAAPDELSSRFEQSFDRIMLDAPCSGEGMFRKDENAIAEWSPDHVTMCAARQWDILQEAYLMLKPGGTLAYSTCTFNRQENEETVERFMSAFPDMELLQMKRLWPHQEQGEGHFVAVLRKSINADSSTAAAIPSTSSKKKLKQRKSNSQEQQALDSLEQFRKMASEEWPGLVLPAGKPLLFGDSLYLLPTSERIQFQDEQLKGLRIPRAGLHLAHLKKNRMEPAHALAMTLRAEQARQALVLEVDAPELRAYLRGETIAADSQLHGWVLVTVNGLPLGFGKASNGQLKNHLPKGLRIPNA